MNCLSTFRRGCNNWNVIASVVLAAFVSTSVASQPWTQWGGAQRNFMVEDSAKLADQWPKDGPPQKWSRKLGDGYATILVEGDRLYTMYRVENDELTICLSAKTGETIWEHKNASPFTELMAQFGPGPSSTPVIAGDRIFSAGTNMMLTCFNKSDGKVQWSHNLSEEYKADVPGRGYTSSPIAFENTIILPVGGEGQSLVAFNQSDGSIVWKKHDFGTTHSSPILIKNAGQTELVAFMAAEVIGLNPKSGELLWSHPHETQYGANLATPLWTGDDLIYVSAAYDSGSRVIQLVKEGTATKPKELWYSRKVRIHHANAVRIGDHLYASSGDFGPAFFACINAKTGELAWRERGFAKATCLLADGKIILLDEDGTLALVQADPKGMKVISQCQPLERLAWTAPTLSGTTLYLRDRQTIKALDLK
jgi:outer membrane protein assembly factor BamB